MEELTDKEGEEAVKIAREVVDSFVKSGSVPGIKPPLRFKEKQGVFVTLNTYPGHELRGCIGYPEPVMPFIEALKDAAVSACSRDPRFNPVAANELDKLVVEITILSPPKKLAVKARKDLPKKIKVGRDGLIMRRGGASGLLLPQAPIEWGWDEEEFLCQTCSKAGLALTAWLDEGTDILTFQGQVFAEEKPRGDVVRKGKKEC